MTLVVLGAAILTLLLLIGRFKINAFLALILTSLAVGLANGMSFDATVKSVLRGVGDTMGSIALIVVFGAILGKIIEESGAAHAISGGLTRIFGPRRIQISVLITGFVVGLPMIYNASFLVLIPLVYTLSATTGLPLLYLGIPLSSALSVTHGYLPPHPAPTSIAAMYGADVNRTLLYGLLLAVPATILAGPVLARFFRKHTNTPPAQLFVARNFSAADLPGIAPSLLTVLSPIVLIAFGADPTIALLTAVIVAFVCLRRGRSMEDLMSSVANATASVSMVLLIIGSGGAFKQVLLDCGTGEAIRQAASKLTASPLILAWSAAALLRLALGSATVAAITAAGIVLPVIPGSGVAPELLVIATTAGSLMFSHFNDIGFWMFKEYYNATVAQTFQIWTVMESIVAVVGLVGTLLLAQLLYASPAKRVVYINSYHAGYPTSDAITAAIRTAMSERAVALEVVYLDAKRDAAGVPRRAREIADSLKQNPPSVLIASDDDAVKFVVAPHFKEGPFPVVFCGVNWDAAQYGLPTPNVTGILEVLPIDQALDSIRKQFPAAQRLTVLSEDSLSERNNTVLLEPRYRAHGFTPSFRLVSDFAAWKRAFAEAQSTADVLYLPTNGAIQGWNSDEARASAEQQTRVPSFTCDAFMTPYSAFGLTKIAEEQGVWAATTALAILGGRSPRDFPLTSNRGSACYVNDGLAAKSRFTQPSGKSCNHIR